MTHETGAESTPMTPYDITAGDDLRRWRLDRGWTQAQLGQAVHRTRETVGLWERGQQPLPPWLPDVLAAIERSAS